MTTDTAIPEKLLTKEELANYLGISTTLISRHCRKSDFPKINVGLSEKKKKLRFRLGEVLEWFERRNRLKNRR